MSSRSLLSCLLLSLALSGAALAAHITDKLVVGVYPEPKAEGTPLRLIASGTPLEVLQRKDDFNEVRLADDTRGWVESGYVSDEKPARAMLLETQAKLRQMGIELAALREKGGTGDAPTTSPDSAPPTAREAQLRQSLQQAERRVAELEQELARASREQAAKAQLDALRERTAQALQLLADAQGMTLSERDPQADESRQDWFARYRPWIIGLGALLLGIAIGVAFVDYRIRKRYGGFRI